MFYVCHIQIVIMKQSSLFKWVNWSFTPECVLTGQLQKGEQWVWSLPHVRYPSFVTVCVCADLRRGYTQCQLHPSPPVTMSYEALKADYSVHPKPPHLSTEREMVASLSHTRKTGLACVLKHCWENASRSHSTVCKSQEHLYQDKADENNLITRQIGKLSQCLSQHNALCFLIKLQ